MRHRKWKVTALVIAATIFSGVLPIPPAGVPHFLAPRRAEAFTNYFVTEQISVSSAGDGANGGSRVDETAVSFSGRYIAFVSGSTNLVAGDTNATSDVFVRDRLLGSTTRASLQSDGSQFTCGSNYPAITGDARYVVFECNGLRVRDQQTNTTALVAGETPGTNWRPDISADGRFVVYQTINKVTPQDTNVTSDIYLVDRDTDQDGVFDEVGATSKTLVSSNVGGAAAGNSEEPTISADGRFVAFSSGSAITGDDGNGVSDVFVRDVVAGTTTLVSRGSAGEYGTLSSSLAEISDDGRAVAFESLNEFYPEYEPPGYEWSDVFVRFWQAGITAQASYRQGDNDPNNLDNIIFSSPSVSADGRYITFHNQPNNVWVRDLGAPFAAIVSLDNAGAPVPGLTYARQISGNGETVVFESEGAFLPGDTGDPDVFARDWGPGAMPPGQAGGASGDEHTDGGPPGVGEPVNPTTGEYFTRTLDAKLPGIGLPFQFTRNYTSGDTTSGPLGKGWTHSYALELKVLWNGDIRIETEWGRKIEFRLMTGGTYTADAGVRDTLVKLGDGTYKLTRRDQVAYAFDTQGRLSSLKERNNQGLTFSYTSGNLTTITDSVGRQIALAYTSGRITQLTLPDGRSVGYGYTNGLLTTVTDLRDGVMTFTYDATDRLDTIIDQNNHLVVNNDYGSDGRVTQQRDALNHLSTYAWDSATGTMTYTDARNNLWKYVHDGNLLTKVITPGNDTTSFKYDPNRNIKEITDASGRTWVMTYDARGNMLTRTAPGSFAIVDTWTYTLKNDVDAYTDPRGFVFDLVYDTAGNLKTINAPESSVTQLGRNATTGLVESVTDPNGKVWTYQYDGEGKVTAIISPRAGNKTTFGYDASDRVNTVVEPRGYKAGNNPADYTWTITYDDADNLLTRSSPLRFATTNVWDPAGNLDLTRDQKNRATDYVYDAADRLTDVVAPDSSTTHYGYDSVGNLTTRTDAEDRTWTFAYSNKNQLSSTTSPLSKVWTFTYWPTRVPKRKTLPSGGTVDYSYDELDRLTQILYSATSTPDVIFTYDKNSNLKTMNDEETSNAVYAYDGLNRISTVTRGTNVFSYLYDPAGNVTRRTFPPNAQTNFTYFEDGLLKTVTQGTASTTYAYDEAGHQTTATLASGNGHVETRTWDRDGRVTGVTHKKGATTLASFAYTLDEVGNPTLMTTNAGTTKYTYDPQRDFLTEVCYQASCPGGSDPFIRYTYNDVGNRLTEVRPTGTTTYTYNADDRLTSTSGPSGNVTYGYNANGDMNAKGSRTYGWDLEGRMVSTTSAGATQTFDYDGLGRRLKWTRGAGSAQIAKYLWDENHPYPLLGVERDGADTFLRRYAYGNSLQWMRAGPDDLYFHQDRIGSVTNVTSATGAKQWTYVYEPFGNERTTTKNSSTAVFNPMRFSSEYIDNAPNHYNLRARYYDPADGRFFSLDPYPASSYLPYTSPYAYVNNQPTVFTDPTGKCFIVCAVVGGFVGAVTYGARVAFDDNIGFTWRGLGVYTAAGVVTGFTAGAGSALGLSYLGSATLGGISSAGTSIFTAAACGAPLPTLSELGENAFWGGISGLSSVGLANAAPTGSILTKELTYQGRHAPIDYLSGTNATPIDIGSTAVDAATTSLGSVGSACK
jgi:RHS repeat-associated protein